MWSQSKGKAKGVGKSQDKGKGKGKSLDSRKGVGHKLPRQRLSAEKFTGTVLSWKGKYGWIKPAEEIPHEKAASHRGNLFTSIDDISGGQELTEGMSVAFHIWEDDSGLGADEVEVVGGGKGGGGGGKAKGGVVAFSGGKAAPKGAAGGKAAPKGAAAFSAPKGPAGFGKGASAPVAAGKGKSWGAVASPGKVMTANTFGKAPVSKGFGKAQDNGKGKGKDKGKDGMKGKGHTLPRNRITAEKFTGTVVVWKGKFGWIQPAEEVPHDKASKNKGQLFASKDDLVDVTELTAGAQVEFHIWEDASGLGAEEIVQY